MIEYNDILTYWFPSDTIPKYWFNKNKTTDEYITNTFNDILIKAENHELNHWKASPKGHLALIIVLDQFSRHIYRNDKHNMYKNDIIAYHHAQEFFLYNKDQDLSDLEKMMTLMPFRHKNDINAYHFIIKYISDIESPIWDKFKKHTLINYKHLFDHGTLPYRSNKQIFDYSKFNSILEYSWVPEMQNYDIVCPISSTLIKFCIDNFAPKDKNINNLIIVSLSGGVDSMAILYVLSIIKNTLPSNLLIVAIHLDYHNRPETGLEAEFIFRWCALMSIPLYYKYINEGVRERTSKNRELYEELTKQIRFDLYKHVRDLYSSYYFMGVILGHHKGDLQENIFFNMVKGRPLSDLSVIKIQSEILGVKILRPLLSHPKKEIFELAHKTKIPYFKNTTPSWSNRGQYREIIQPAIIKTFGEGVLTNLSKIGKESDEIQLLMNDYIIKPYLNSIMFKDNKYYFEIRPNMPFTFWKYVFHEWCHQNNIPLISYKLITQIYEKIYTNKDVKITCNNNLKVSINKGFIEVKI